MGRDGDGRRRIGRQYGSSPCPLPGTEFSESLKTLSAVAERRGPEWFLTGQNWFGLGDYKKAAEAFEKAVSLESSNAVYYNWLGKAFGRRAETSSMLTAPGLAGKCRQAFEKAVEIDPRNVEAASDLFEYYLEAPGFMGGGISKAEEMAKRIAALDAAAGHHAQARLAEKRKEFAGAEASLRRAVDAAPKQIGRVLDLARFLARHNRLPESDEMFSQAQKLAPTDPRVMFARAETSIRARRNLPEARDLLKRYLGAKLTPDDPPRAEAAKLLKQAGG